MSSNCVKLVFPIPQEKKVCLRDNYVTRITFDEDSMVFYFDKGFTIEECDGSWVKRKGKVTLSGISPDDVFCEMIGRKPSSKGLKLLGKPFSISQLSELLSRNEIEVFSELIDTSTIHWKGNVVAKNRGFFLREKMFSIIVLEFTGSFSMTFSWD